MSQKCNFDGLEMETFWPDLEALQGLAKELSNEIVDICRPLRVVEVGSWVGRTALNFLEVADIGDVRVYCVDTWEGTDNDVTGELAKKYGRDHVFRTFCDNVGRRLFREIFPCRGTSSMWAEVWPFEADLIFLDGDHSLPAARADILNWSRHVRSGGILCGHDYDVFPGVTQAVKELCGEVKVSGQCVWWKRM